MTSLSILINQSGLSQQNGLTEADLTSPNIVYLDEIDELYQAGKFAEAVEKCGDLFLRERLDFDCAFKG